MILLALLFPAQGKPPKCEVGVVYTTYLVHRLLQAEDEDAGSSGPAQDRAGFLRRGQRLTDLGKHVSKVSGKVARQSGCRVVLDASAFNLGLVFHSEVTPTDLTELTLQALAESPPPTSEGRHED